AYRIAESKDGRGLMLRRLVQFNDVQRMYAAARRPVLFDHQAMKFQAAVEERRQPRRQRNAVSQIRRLRIILGPSIHYVFGRRTSAGHAESAGRARVPADGQRHAWKNWGERVGALLQLAAQLLRPAGALRGDADSIQIAAERLGHGLGLFQITVELSSDQT